MRKVREFYFYNNRLFRRVIFTKLFFFNSRNLPVAFQNEILSRCYVNVGQIPGSILMEQCETDDSLHRVIHIVAGTLPRIIPNILQSHREVGHVISTECILHELRFQ